MYVVPQHSIKLLNCNVYDFIASVGVKKARLLERFVFHDGGSQANFAIQTFLPKNPCLLLFLFLRRAKKRSKFLKSEDFGGKDDSKAPPGWDVTNSKEKIYILNFGPHTQINHEAGSVSFF